MTKPLPKFIMDQLNYLFSFSTLQLKVDQVWSSGIDSRYSDHFTLTIPFCLDYIKWDFMYNLTYPSLPPDIVFPVEDEEFNPLIDIVGEGKDSCLKDWNSKDPSRLMTLVNEMRDLYMDYHKKRVVKLDDDRLQFEANTMMITREGIEVRVIPRADGLDGAASVRFVMALLEGMDMTKLVPGCSWDSHHKIYLEVAFPVSTGYQSPKIRLVPSHSDWNSLFSVEDIKLPQWVNGMCMAEYLPVVEDNLQLQMVAAVASIGQRRRFIEALSASFGRPVEADPIFCRKAAVYVTLGHFMFLVHFEIPLKFPSQQPALTLQGYQQSDPSVSKWSPAINNYPWSPRWSNSQMVQRIREFLEDESLNFKICCSEAAP